MYSLTFSTRDRERRYNLVTNLQTRVKSRTPRLTARCKIGPKCDYFAYKFVSAYHAVDNLIYIRFAKERIETHIRFVIFWIVSPIDMEITTT